MLEMGFGSSVSSSFRMFSSALRYCYASLEFVACCPSVQADHGMLDHHFVWQETRQMRRRTVMCSANISSYCSQRLCGSEHPGRNAGICGEEIIEKLQPRITSDCNTGMTFSKAKERSYKISSRVWDLMGMFLMERLCTFTCVGLWKILRNAKSGSGN